MPSIPEQVIVLLKQYTELGLLTITHKSVTVQHCPIFTQLPGPVSKGLYSNIKKLIKWLSEYVSIHNYDNTVDGTYFFTVFDGFREHTAPSLSGDYVKITELDITKYNTIQFYNTTQLNEPYPIFPYPVISWSRHKGDLSVVLIPDHDYITSNGYTQLILEIKHNDIPWAKKVNKLFWRGGNNGSKYSIYDSTMTKNQRELAMDVGASHIDVFDISSSGSVPKSEFLKYKYLLDVDGMVNAWSAFFWKLGSNSVILKLESHWEEWYYDQIQPWVHYIPVKGDASDLYEKYLWAETNETKVLEIIRNANELVYKNRYEYTLFSKKIATNFKDSKELVKKYYP